ncbi:formate dehydrogenase accessory sulfurtransferase FdhD [Sediminihaliea albiluteola]|uniref:formate dehydrogenase accessory sulfurtransferase FdhD n=1 Tax=Sediminihaliea albiluteola TaxID=2758564 RepID=UPI002E2A7CDC|nr:formate dehydrogenase accessory sulfurtransferase FdhD [Sediminihaliea albiluteola]
MPKSIAPDQGHISASVEVYEQGEATERASDQIAAECAVALVYQGISHAVMMASPMQLEDFALGFSLSEGILQQASELYDLEIVEAEQGIRVEMAIASERVAALRERRRSLTGRTGCGLCGAESLTEAVRPIKPVVAPQLSASAVQRALVALPNHQPLQQQTGASHAAAFCNSQGEIVLVREDIGRHNAMDKLIGALQGSTQPLSEGFALISSRASYEMVHKSCAAGIGALVAVSAPTAMAIDMARQAGQLLIAFARPGRHVIYHNPHGSP